MRMWVVAAVLACLAFPAVASGDSGAITDVYPLDEGRVSATFTVTSTTCNSKYYCGFNTYAVQTPSDQRCLPSYVVPKEWFIHAGQGRQDLGTFSQTDSFNPRWASVRLCLYISEVMPEWHTLVAEYVYTPPQAVPPTSTAPAPTPAPAAPSPVDEYSPMQIGEAKGLVPSVLRKEYRSRFARSTLRRACSRLSSRKVRCRVAWTKRPYRYTGTVTLWYDDEDVADNYSTYSYRTSVRRSGSLAATG
jgi:hypothetical protein